MDREHRDTEFGGRLHSSGYSVGDIVQLEIEEDLSAGVDQFRDDLWRFGGKELKADLVERDRITQFVDDFLGINGSGDVQGDNQPVFWGGHAGILARKSVPPAIADV